jgi:hypothetical protein
MAFWLAKAMISTMPTWAYRLLSSPRSEMPATAPKIPSGTTRITANGVNQFSY